MSVKANQIKNSIIYLRDDADHKVTEPEAIRAMVQQYYQDLLGITNSDVIPLSVNTIKQLHLFRCLYSLAARLISVLTDKETCVDLYALPKSKAPGPNGFTMKFFILSWELVGNDFIAAVQELFRLGKIVR